MTSSKLTVIEARLQSLEGEVAKLKKQVEEKTTNDLPWWEKHWGIFADDPDYDAAMELGRKYRESLRPKPTRKRASKKSPKPISENGES